MADSKDISKFTAIELYAAIRGYKGNAWVTSPEFAELERRLSTLSVKELEAKGFWIPNWKTSKK